MITEWYDFLEKIRAARTALGDPETVWYRGHSNANWALIPSLHRISNGLDKEQALFLEYHRSASRLFTQRDNDWEILFDMQHYGIPTRLLDWTEALGIAVAFAVLDHNPSYGNLAIWVLDPIALNQHSGLTGIKEIPSNNFEYKDVYWQNKPFAAKNPIAIAPRLQSERMVAQNGTFTIHGTDGRQIGDICPGTIVMVELPESALDGAREFLEYGDLTPYKIYPDILGMARHIRRKILGL